jgi:serine phosphatase RsbU (regulator of sigma subunit)/tetratricopeptide (TPR) repeat protein
MVIKNILLKLFLFAIITLLIIKKGYTQSEKESNKIIDSLTLVIKHKPQTLKAASAYISLSEILYLSNADTIKPLCDSALAITNIYLDSEISGEREEALRLRAQALNNLGYVYDNFGNKAKALEFYLEGLKIREKINDKRGMGESFNNIGAIYKSQRNVEKALEFYEKSLSIREENGDKKGVATVLNNLAVLFDENNNEKKALEIYLSSLKLYEELGDKTGISNIEYNLGVIYYNLGDNYKARDYYLKSLQKREEIDDKKGIAIALLSIGTIELDKNQLKQAKKYGETSLEIAKKLGFPETISASANLLYKIYCAENNWKEALKMLELYTEMQEVLFSEEQIQTALRAELNYEFEKKEQASLLEQEKKDALALEELKKQKIQRNGFIAGFALMMALAGVSFRNFRNKRKAHQLIAHQKEIVEEKNNSIIASINYAKRIQEALLKEVAHISELIPHHFILFKPKDIVSGDFYWSCIKKVKSPGVVIDSKQANKSQEEASEKSYLYLAAVDCTGHGVPGAFMSMLGIAFLNEISAREELLTPGEMLDLLREKVIKELSQEGQNASSFGVKDGMDMSLIRIELNNFNNLSEAVSIEFAGANNPIYIINKISNELKEIKGDKQPIGFYHNQQKFANHSISLTKDESIYIFTDGYADQFGGEKGKKFKYNRLKELLVSIQQRNMQEQKLILEDTIETWKGNLEQVDDICMIGIKR